MVFLPLLLAPATRRPMFFLPNFFPQELQLTPHDHFSCRHCFRQQSRSSIAEAGHPHSLMLRSSLRSASGLAGRPVAAAAGRQWLPTPARLAGQVRIAMHSIEAIGGILSFFSCPSITRLTHVISVEVVRRDQKGSSRPGSPQTGRHSRKGDNNGSLHSTTSPFRRSRSQERYNTS